MHRYFCLAVVMGWCFLCHCIVVEACWWLGTRLTPSVCYWLSTAACFPARQQTGSLGTVCSLSPIKDVRGGRLAGEPVGLMTLDKHWFLWRLGISFQITARSRLRGTANLDTIKIYIYIYDIYTETRCPMPGVISINNDSFWVSVAVFGGEGNRSIY